MINYAFTSGWIFGLMILEKLGEGMSFYNSLYIKKPKKIISSGNVLDLIQKAKVEQKKEKRQNIIIAAAAI